MVTIQIGNPVIIWEPLHGGPYIELFLEEGHLIHCPEAQFTKANHIADLNGINILADVAPSDLKAVLSQILDTLKDPQSASVLLNSEDELLALEIRNKVIALLAKYLA